MSHSDKGNRLISHLSKREYPYSRDRDGSSKRQALAKLAADDATIRDAANSRAAPVLNRQLTEREQRQGNWTPDTRTPAEKIRQDTTHLSQPAHDPERDYQAERVATLQKKLAKSYSNEDKFKIQRRIDLALAESQKFQTALAARKEREALMASPAVTDALVIGKAWVARLETNPACPQEWCDRAKARLERLQLTGDTESFWRETDAFEAERQTVLEQRTQALDAEAAAVRAQAAEVRRESKEEITPEPIPA